MREDPNGRVSGGGCMSLRVSWGGVAASGAQPPKLVSRRDDAGRVIQVRVLLTTIVAGRFAGSSVHDPRCSLCATAKDGPNALWRSSDDSTDCPIGGPDTLAV